MANKDTFSGLHPTVIILYFILVLGLTMFITHPIFLALSFLCALTYSIYLNGKQTVRFQLLYMLPLLIVTALLNPVFNHYGITILTYLPGGNPLTLESILYGVSAVFLLITVITWFSCFNGVMTSDKFIYLFGRIIPSLSLILSIVLRLIPRFKTQMKIISNAQRCLGRDMQSGSLIKRARHGMRILSILITWALEHAIDTADSMKSRGYGLSGRTAFSIYRFEKRDKKAIIFMLLFGIAIIIGAAFGALDFSFYPMVKSAKFNIFQLALFIMYFLLCTAPMLINKKEDLKWNARALPYKI